MIDAARRRDVLLCWLALLLIRVAKRQTSPTRRRLTRELQQRVHS